MPWQKIVLYLPNPENIGVVEEFLKIEVKKLHVKNTLINAMVTFSVGSKFGVIAQY